LPTTAVLSGLLAAGVFDKDAPHGFRSGGEEMTAVVPTRVFAVANQTQIGFMNQGRRLQGLPRLFLG